MRGLVFAESFVLGAVATLAVTVRPPGMLYRGRNARANYRGKTVAGTLGAVLLVPLVLGGWVAFSDGAPRDAVAAVTGAGALLGAVGLVDDVYGNRHARGLAGHARALLHGKITTGTVKAASGAAIGLAAAWLWDRHGRVTPTELVVDGAVVALTAHVVNLLDVRPGRALKAWLVAFAGLALTAGLTGGVLAAAMLAGGAAGFLEPDLRERGMLGDVGAAVLGASLGAAAVVSLARPQRVWAAALLGLIAVSAELTSFSRVIDRVGPLRFVDALGRRGSE
jgi:UDP-N-acetylmuramyl pentapeptide phosphotransferase/UDP-N-acetylglucosamine-1-phosphate transferase